MQPIVHLMMMQLNYPASTALFYGAIFEYVTFDLLPIEDIYIAIFAFDSEPYSEEADAVGYSSRYWIENTGCLTLYFVLIIVEQIIASVILKSASSESKTYNFSREKRSRFFWSGAIDFLNDMYMNAVFSIGINLTALGIIDSSTGFNNIMGGFVCCCVLVAPVVIAFKLGKVLVLKFGLAPQ